jgi:hypothetical protein
MNARDLLKEVNETPEARETRRLRELDALDEAGLLTFSEECERTAILRRRVLRSVR